MRRVMVCFDIAAPAPELSKQPLLLPGVPVRPTPLPREDPRRYNGAKIAPAISRRRQQHTSRTGSVMRPDAAQMASRSEGSPKQGICKTPHDEKSAVELFALTPEIQSVEATAFNVQDAHPEAALMPNRSEDLPKHCIFDTPCDETSAVKLLSLTPKIKTVEEATASDVPDAYPEAAKMPSGEGSPKQRIIVAPCFEKSAVELGSFTPKNKTVDEACAFDVQDTCTEPSQMSSRRKGSGSPKHCIFNLSFDEKSALELFSLTPMNKMLDETVAFDVHDAYDALGIIGLGPLLFELSPVNPRKAGATASRSDNIGFALEAVESEQVHEIELTYEALDFFGRADETSEKRLDQCLTRSRPPTEKKHVPANSDVSELEVKLKARMQKNIAAGQQTWENSPQKPRVPAWNAPVRSSR